MTTAKDALAALGITDDEVAQMQQELKQQTRRDSRVCICGYPMSRHDFSAGVGVALVRLPKSEFTCKSSKAVLKVGDTRLFLRTTTGPGPEHALTKGMVATAMAGKEVEWLVDVECSKCKTTEGRISPVPLTAGLTIAYEASSTNALLCEDCMMGL